MQQRKQRRGLRHPGDEFAFSLRTPILVPFNALALSGIPYYTLSLLSTIYLFDLIYQKFANKCKKEIILNLHLDFRLLEQRFSYFRFSPV